MGNEPGQADGFKAAGSDVALQFPAQGAVPHQVEGASGRGKAFPRLNQWEDAFFLRKASGVKNVPAGEVWRGRSGGGGFLPDEVGDDPDFVLRYSGLDEELPLAAADGDVGGKAVPGAHAARFIQRSGRQGGIGRAAAPAGVQDAGKVVAVFTGEAGGAVPVEYPVEASGAVVVQVVDDGNGLLQGQPVDAGGHGRERVVDDPRVIAVSAQAFAQLFLHVPVAEHVAHFRQRAVGALEQLRGGIDKGGDVRHGTQLFRDGAEADFLPPHVAVAAENM